jgi:hypothetical protein
MISYENKMRELNNLVLKKIYRHTFFFFFGD